MSEQLAEIESYMPSFCDESEKELSRIDTLNHNLEAKYKDLMVIEPALSRGVVSFQANKSRAVYRWYKFKEAFSAGLVEYLLNRYEIKKGKLLDPFGGSGTALFASSALGMHSVGIELLPIGQEIIETKKIIDGGLSDSEMKILLHWADSCLWEKSATTESIPELRITKFGYSEQTLSSMGKYLAQHRKESPKIQQILKFALLCVLEVISFTRKDGQYLRWDFRSERRQGKRPFNKGDIPSFDQAISLKLRDIVGDLSNPKETLEIFSNTGNCTKKGEINLHSGSCLQILPELTKSHFDCIITSPPYCNRYDYTRTYALELALLGVNESRLSELRQEMLSCTVENRAKDLLKLNSKWSKAVAAADNQELLQSILTYLENQKKRGILNNNGIPRMVRGYFYEMACVIQECSRVLKSGAHLMMVNDNVRYAGASISVDIILSEIAVQLGFKVDKILISPNGKGNSSQQMGEHGREALRKCVYVWKKI